MFKFQFAVLLLFILSSCSSIKFNEGIHATDPAYGYSPKHPIALYANFEEEASRKTAEYFNDLENC